MEKKEYESIEAAADKLQSEAERDFSRKVLMEQGYKKRVRPGRRRPVESHKEE